MHQSSESQWDMQYMKSPGGPCVIDAGGGGVKRGIKTPRVYSGEIYPARNNFITGYKTVNQT